VLDTRDGVVVKLRGEAGVPEAAALEASLLGLVARRPPRVTFDLGELRFISSLAMGVLVAFRRGAVRTGARVCLAASLHPAVREALTRADLLPLFEAAGESEPCPGPGPVTAEGGPAAPNGNDVQGTFEVTWDQLVELEPQVEQLLWRARMTGGPCRTFADVDRAFDPVRNDLAELIGFAGKHRRHPVLGSPVAYEVAYWKLYDAVAELVRPRRQRVPA
jgi:anti-anti-sigma factor